MKYFTARNAEGVEWILPLEPNAHEAVLSRFDGRVLSLDWQPLSTKLLKQTDSGNVRKPSDFPAFASGVLACNRRAIDALGGLLELFGELLPLNGEGKAYYAYNVTAMIACLDYKRSLIKQFSDGSVMRVAKYAFNTTKLEGIHIFKIPEIPRMEVFVSEVFAARFHAEGLTGLVFKCVYEE